MEYGIQQHQVVQAAQVVVVDHHQLMVVVLEYPAARVLLVKDFQVVQV